jgi:hypothetical protein
MFGLRVHARASRCGLVFEYILYFIFLGPRRLFSSLFTNAAKNCLLKKVLLVGKKLSHGQIK